MTKLKYTFIALITMLCALTLTSCMDLYDDYEVTTITFVGNGGATYTGATSYTQTGTQGETKKLTSNAFFLDGKAFLGWSEDKTSTSATYQDEVAYKFESDKTLYAIWTDKTVTITFNANGGAGSMEPQTFTQGVQQKLNKCTFTFEGKIFAGWAESSDAGSAAYLDEAAISPDRDKTLYAVWQTANIIVSFDPNGGAGSMEPQTFVYDVSQKLNKCTFTHPSKHFAGWSTNQSAQSGTYSDESSVSFTKNTILYAIWRDKCTITFRSSLGQTTTQLYEYTQLCAENETVNLTPNAFLRDGFEFIGWGEAETTVDDDTGVIYQDGASVTVTKNIDLYTIWKAGNRELWVAQGGNDDTGTGVDEDHAYATLTAAIKRINKVSDTDRDWTVKISGAVTAGDQKIDSLSAKSLSIIGKTGSDDDSISGSGSVIEIVGEGDKTIFINKIKITGGNTENGGGININASKTTLTLGSDVLVTANVVSGNGGGIYIKSGTLKLNGTEISSNTGAANGGGIYVAGGQVEMAGGTIKAHTVTGNGGGVYVESGTFNLQSGSIGASGAANAAANGGGIYNEGGTVNMTGGDISYNTAGASSNGNGGGVYNTGTFRISGGQITKNIAGNFSEDDNNSKGGGIYNEATLEVSGNVIIGDDSITASLDTSESASLDSCQYANFSNGYGGGIYNINDTNATCTFEGTEYKVFGNLAKVKGGGIYDDKGSGSKTWDMTYVKQNYAPSSPQSYPAN